MTRTQLKKHLCKIGISETFSIISLSDCKCCIKTKNYLDKYSIYEKLLDNNFTILKDSKKYTSGNINTSRDVYLTFFVDNTNKKDNSLNDSDHVYIPMNHIMSFNRL